MGEMNNAYKVVLRKREGTGPLGRSTRRWGEQYQYTHTHSVVVVR
jgi:hypothetical protein